MTAHRPIKFEIVGGAPADTATPEWWHLAVDAGNGERWLTSETYTSETDAARSRADFKARALETLLRETLNPSKATDELVALLLDRLAAGVIGPVPWTAVDAVNAPRPELEPGTEALPVLPADDA